MLERTCHLSFFSSFVQLIPLLVASSTATGDLTRGTLRLANEPGIAEGHHAHIRQGKPATTLGSGVLAHASPGPSFSSSSTGDLGVIFFFSFSVL